MSSYQHSPQDEGYSEDPLTVGSVSGSAVAPPWVQNMPVAERTGRLQQNADTVAVTNLR